MSSVQTQLHGRVAVIRIDNPPVNGLGHDVRRGIVDGLRRSEADPAIQAIVIIGSDALFSGGADIREFGTPKMLAEPNLHTVINFLETSTKPVIAALAGTCVGGGLEMALACHYRIAKPDTQVALPEVKLGLLPGAGGTQRLPRAIGLEPALNLIVSGESVPAAMFKGSALVDRLSQGDLLEDALAFAESTVQDNRPLRRVRDLKVTHPKPEAFLLWARTGVGQMAKNFPAPLKCIDAVEAAVGKSFDEGMKVERDAFAQLLMSDESRALRHLFFAERAAPKITDVPEDTPVRKIQRVGVIGAGTMGSGIAVNFLNAGIAVVILETRQDALDRGVKAIRKIYDDRVAKGKLAADKAEQRVALLKPTLSYDDLRDVDLAIEAVFEDMAVKEAVFQKLDEVCKPGTILASNTSTLDIDRIAGFTRRPQDVIGLHFFSPANVMRLLEVVRGAKTGKDVLATSMKLAKTIKKTAVLSGVCDGFIGNRMVAVYVREALTMLTEGASPQQIDGAIERFGFAMGPFKMADLAGGDIGWAVRKRKYAENPNMPRALIADRLCEMGRFGQKTGAGYYRYEPGRRDALHDPEVDRVIAACREELRVAPRKIPDEEIVQRCVFALVNEGARILEEGIAQRASDIDLVYLMGYGFPIHRGGPMLYADMMGPMNVVRLMEGIARNPFTDGAFWQPAPLLARLAGDGKTFN
jgi:3-hydroxyacyl-CoA dehydrogenase